MKKANKLTLFLKKTGDWADQNKFWSDTIRAIVLGVLGTFLVATVIESLKNDIAYAAEKEKAKLALRINIIKDFTETSYHFTSSAVRYKAGQISFTDLRDEYDRYRAIQHQMGLLSKVEGIKDQMENVAKKMKLIINQKDTLVKYNTFEKVRLEIKAQSDSIEINALDNL